LNNVLKEKRPWYRLESLYTILESQRYMFIESRLVDIAFNCTLNLTCYYIEPEYSFSSLISLAISLAMFSRLIFQYSELLQKVYWSKSAQLEKIEDEICNDNILEKIAETHPSGSRSINLIMKLNFFLIPLLVILLQNCKNGVCVMVALL
jgi:hypothetical protein